MSRTSRRDFARALALTGAALPLAAQAKPSEPMLQVVRARYGQHLDDADLERIGAALSEYAPAIERLRSFKLVNSDEPDFNARSCKP
jgi:hypothetical protein